ncbi:tyrosine-type recombinase/integrase [Micromonospora sp. A3M-1-15]|uniref:tyrosine-type recombinase/integrase n=1 Tax=Micromonospora sp. A3M-1-15 TaxID=2962035 RepID=UPI0020B657C4|nr:tyrosine-type recombinase/integrase [Micromonospora sp. A3M-1-15]MCP3785384.1 tyrosine-type recombinase/integrase [Micromonospora sp. A3M-1-15]
MRTGLMSGNVAKLVRAALAEVWVDHGLVFPSERGTPLEPTKLSRSFARLRETAGLPGVRLHDLRHTVASLLMELGVPPHVVQAIARHADVKVTLKVCSHANFGAMRQGARQARRAAVMNRIVVSVAVIGPSRGGYRPKTPDGIGAPTGSNRRHLAYKNCAPRPRESVVVGGLGQPSVSRPPWPSSSRSVAVAAAVSSCSRRSAIWCPGLVAGYRPLKPHPLVLGRRSAGR